MRVEILGDSIEAIPLLAEFRRFVRRVQEIAAFPLDVVDDASPIEAAMQTDGDESRLARHEAGPLDHQGQGFVLLAGLGLDDRDLRDGLMIGSNLRHRLVPFAKNSRARSFGAVSMENGWRRRRVPAAPRPRRHPAAAIRARAAMRRGSQTIA